MYRALLSRTISAIMTLWIVSILVFTLVQLPPGDFLTTALAELEFRSESAAAAKKLAYLRSLYGLDQPYPIQYLRWMGGLLQGDLGWSFVYERPVSELIGDRMLLTFLIAFSTVLFTYIVSFPIGIYSATHQHSTADYCVTFVGFLGLATPNFLLALVCIFFAKLWFGTSIGGLMDPEYINASWSIGKILSVMEHMVIPVIVIGTSGTAAMIRRLRANMLDELRKQYVTTARAKGLGPTRLLIKYPMRMALNPFIADIGSLLPQVISGSAAVSIVMDLPTSGRLLLEALQAQDMYLAGSFLMFLSALTILGIFLSDLLLVWFDPRIRLGTSR